MNLLGKKTRLIILSAFLLYACEDPGEIGLNEPLNNDLKVEFTEITVPSSQILIDSVNSGFSPFLQATFGNNFLTGVYNDPFFGKITAISYAQLAFIQFDDIPDDAVYDSLVMTLEPIYYHGTDTISPKNLNVYQVQNQIASGFHFTNEINPLDRLIGSETFGIDLEREELKFKLDDSFGMELFDLAKDTTSTVFDSLANFINYFPGVALVSDENNEFVIGFDPGTGTNLDPGMTLYYHQPGDTIVTEIDFLFNGQPRFNHIDVDRTGTVLEGLSNPYEDFQTIDGNTYMQSGTGVFTKLDLSSISDLADTLSDLTIIKAELVINGIKPFSEFLQPPENIIYYFVNENNRLFSGLTPSFAKSIQAQSQTLLVAPLSSNNPLRVEYDQDINSYSSEITLTAKNIAEGILENSSVLIFASAPVNFDNVFYPNMNNLNRFAVDKQNIKLRLFYSHSD